MTRNFSQELNISIRTEHSELNKLIIQRLPLCLPPHTDNPLLYAQGLTLFGSIFSAFEARLQYHLADRIIQCRIVNSLELVNTQGIHRTERLQRDLTDIQQRLEASQWQRYKDMTVQAAKFTDRITAALSAKPHLILAYAWTMYLAIFNGGRWIRTQLDDAGEVYWRGPRALSFWNFDGPQDGELIRAQFKADFERAAHLLTDEEWADVKQEVKRVFGFCFDMIGVLDESAAQDAASMAGRSVQKGWAVGMMAWSTILYGVILYLLAILLRPLWQALPSWSSADFALTSAKSSPSEFGRNA